MEFHVSNEMTLERKRFSAFLKVKVDKGRVNQGRILVIKPGTRMDDRANGLASESADDA
jgi:translation initiation factor 6 (eIF-6)